MVIMLSIQGMAYVKSAKILIANLVQVKSTGHQTKQKFGFIKRVDKGWITTVKDLKSFLNLTKFLFWSPPPTQHHSFVRN